MSDTMKRSVALILTISGSALAQPSGSESTAGTADTSDATQPAAEPAIGSAIGLQFNLDFTNAYFYRGIIQEDTGLIVQPAARMTVNLVEDDSHKLDVFAGTWNSFHGQKTASNTAGDFSEYWYESDLYAGVTLTAGKISLTASYTFLTSPNDAFETVQELGFTFGLDDSAWLKEWSLKPYATIAVETGADASDGANSDTGVYLELGIAPGFAFDLGSTPVTVSLPALVGLSVADYYQNAAGEDDTFGFAQVGARASLPLGKPGRYGTWALNGGVSVLFLGDHTQDYNAGDDTEIIGTIGLQWNF
jgi:hypothetical protein